MNNDQTELANHLLAVATAIIEDMAEVSVAGQSPRLSSSQLADHGRFLNVAARGMVMLNGSGYNGPPRRPFRLPRSRFPIR
jgi:hypothetical protein